MPFDNINYDHNDSILRNLIAARALIADERNWTTDIRKIWRGDNDFAFCALGAVEEVMGALSNWHVSDEVKLLAVAVCPIPRCYYGASHAVAHHNNTRGHAATLEMFDKAISARRAELEAVHAV